MKILLAVVTSLMFLTACEFQQDPTKGAPDAVREGRLPDAEKPIPPKAFPKEALQIDAPTLVNGRVGSPVEFKIQGRVMVPDVSFQLSVDNLADFPGATFDPATGDFKWVPTKAQVGSFPSMEMALRVSLVTDATPANPTVSIEKKTISLVIMNAYNKPIINTVTGPSSAVIGASTTKFQVTFEDIDALNEADTTLNVRDCSTWNSESIAHLVDVRASQADAAAGKYKADVYLGLSDSKAASLPSGEYCFAIVAISKHGVSSEPYKAQISIEGKFKNTKATMEWTPVINIGDKVRISFSIFDPTGNGNVSVKSMDDIATMLPGSTLSCKQVWNAKSQVDCAGLIDATNAVENVYEVKIVTENKGSRSTLVTTTDHVLRIDIKKAATP